VPALVLVGEFDTMTDECSQARPAPATARPCLADNLPAAWPLVTIPRAAHCKLTDEPQATPRPTPPRLVAGCPARASDPGAISTPRTLALTCSADSRSNTPSCPADPRSFVALRRGDRQVPRHN
jgi:hypothetical protein